MAIIWVAAYMSVGALLAGLVDADDTVSLTWTIFFWPLLLPFLLGLFIREWFSK